MAGHNKWKQIKNQKAKTDGQKSKLYSKYARLIALEAKKSGGAMSTSLIAVIDRAKKEDVPKDVIDRAVKKSAEAKELETIVYEAYGPGGTAIIIEALTENRNKAAQEIKHILKENGSDIAAIGSASWAFTRENMEWKPNMTVPLEDADLAKLQKLVEELEDNDEVQTIYTNAE
jgi:transcriptional/translational regulatory protein YebC/TACO1